MSDYPIDFDSVPPLGTTINYWRGRTLTLISVASYTRRDGTRSALLEWQSSDGRQCVSGLRAKSVAWRSLAETLAGAATC